MSNGLLHATLEEASAMLQLFNFIFPLSAATQDFLLRHLYPMKLGKGKILHKSGSICDKIYFVNKGAIRGFIKEGKKDSTTWITIENEMVAAIYSFIKQVPSIENMQTIEDCDLLAMRHKDLHTMFEIYPESNILARRIYEKYYADAEVRALTARLSNAEKKYDYFLQTYSHLANRIPLTYIASFLGISLETLSRVRGQKRHQTENRV